jgi:hypothetical protein
MLTNSSLQDVYNQFQAMHSNITIEFNSTSVATESLEKRNKVGFPFHLNFYKMLILNRVGWNSLLPFGWPSVELGPN